MFSFQKIYVQSLSFHVQLDRFKLNTTREKIRSNPELSQKTLNEFRIFSVKVFDSNFKLL